MIRERALKVVLVIVGLSSIAGIYFVTRDLWHLHASDPGDTISEWPLPWVFLVVFVASLAVLLCAHWWLGHGRHRLDKARHCMRTWLTQPVLFLVAYLLAVGTGYWIIFRHPETHMQVRPYVTDPAAPLAVLAIGFAIAQFWDARIHSQRIEEGVESSSTRYIGPFPTNMEDIIRVVAAAKRELVILADSVCYGHFSNPEAYKRFFHELTEACDRHVSVRLLVYSEEVQEGAWRQQFPPEKFEQTRDDQRFHRYFHTFFPGIPEPGTHTEFVDILRRAHRDKEGQLHDKGIRPQFLPKEERFFFWLQDGEDAVFTFENLAAAERQVGSLCFRTRDAKLIEAFSGIFERHWQSERGKEAIRLVVPKAG